MLSLTQLSEPELCSVYQSDSPDRRRCAAEELLRRHVGTIRSLARKASRHADASGTFDDALQQARLAALNAYATFDPARGCAVRTYVHYKISASYGRTNGAEALVRVPEGKRKERAYLLGRSNEPTFAARFERENGIRNSDDRQAFKNKNGGLAAMITPLDEGRMSIDDSTSIVERIDVANAVSELSDKQRAILSLVVLGMSRGEIAIAVGETEMRACNQLLAIRRKLRTRLAG